MIRHGVRATANTIRRPGFMRLPQCALGGLRIVRLLWDHKEPLVAGPWVTRVRSVEAMLVLASWGG